MLRSERNESFSAELPADDPFDPKRLRLLRVIAEAIFTEPPADSAARQENDELVASFAQLFFPGLPEEQARRQLALMVTTLLEEAEQRLAERVASTNGGLSPGWHLTPCDESLIAEVMDRFGMSREEAIESLILNGGI